MSDENKIRLAHELLDEINAREDLTPEQVGVLRSFLPRRPKRVTLEQVFRRANAAWANARGNEWLREEEDLEAALLALRDDLSRLINEPKPAAPALPAGMRLAEHEKYGRCVVSPGVNVAGRYEVFYLAPGEASGAYVEELSPGSLTFIDAEPAHPEFLETVEDYEGAPDRSIVAIDAAEPWIKIGQLWESAVWNDRPSGLMADASRRVLRWGDAK